MFKTTYRPNLDWCVKVTNGLWIHCLARFRVVMGNSAVVWLCRLVALVKQENRSPVEAVGMGKAAKGGKKLPSAPLADKKKKAKKKLDHMDQTCIKLQWLRIWVGKIGIFDSKTWNFIDVMDNGFKKSNINWPSVTRWAVAILVVTPVLEKGIEIWTGWTWSENTRSIYTKTGAWDWCDDSSLPDRTVDIRRVCASQSAQTKKLWIWFDMRKGKCRRVCSLTLPPTVVFVEFSYFRVHAGPRNPLFEKAPRNYRLGGDIQPKRDLTRFVKWPKYIRLQRQKRIMLMRLKAS